MTTEVELENGGLEQRQRKQAAKKVADPDVPDFDNVGEFAAEEAIGVSPDATETEGPADVGSNKVYFVRVPRPPVNDELLKKLQGQFQEHVAKLKVLNGKLGVKRNELRELRGQMGVARGLKDGSQPEYEEKLERIKQLKQLRSSYIDRMQAIRENLRGLECKSEEELEAKVRELENKITHEGVALREEKQIVNQISKLQQQRAAVRDYDNQKGSLTELDQEAKKIKAVIDELDEEFKILRAEREQAQGIIKEILTKVKAAEAELKDMEEEQAEAVKAKNDVLAELDKVRNDMNDSMGDYRDNRSFSLKVRDLIAAGQVDEARALCAAQVDEYVSKLASDAAYRKEYHSLWAQQRKYAVSELLPGSTTAVKEAKPDAPGGKGGASRAAKAAPAKPSKPQGAEKAKALIEELMAQAQQEASKTRRPVSDDEPSGDADDEEDEPAVAAPPPAPVLPAGLPEGIKLPKPAPSKPAEVHKVELPVIEDTAPFVPPIIKADPSSTGIDKDKLREEQMRKAAEAEARKRRLAEQKEKKKREAEVKKKQEEERKKAEALAALQGKSLPKSVPEAPKPVEESTSDKEVTTTSSSAGPALKPANLPVIKSQQTAAAKRVKATEPLVKKLKKFINKNAVLLAVVGVVLLVLILVILSTRS